MEPKGGDAYRIDAGKVSVWILFLKEDLTGSE
jgi:hypothetical protein